MATALNGSETVWAMRPRHDGEQVRRIVNRFEIDTKGAEGTDAAARPRDRETAGRTGADGGGGDYSINSYFLSIYLGVLDKRPTI